MGIVPRPRCGAQAAEMTIRQLPWFPGALPRGPEGRHPQQNPQTHMTWI